MPKAASPAVVVLSRDTTWCEHLRRGLADLAPHLLFCHHAEMAWQALQRTPAVALFVVDLAPAPHEGWRLARFLSALPHRVPVVLVAESLPPASQAVVPGVGLLLARSDDVALQLRAALGGQPVLAPPVALVVDPAVERGQVPQRALAAQGYRLLVATTGEAGRRLLHQHRPQLLLVAQSLLEAEAGALLAECRAAEDGPAVVVAVTSPSPERLWRLWQWGATAWVKKPYRSAPLLARCAAAHWGHLLARLERAWQAHLRHLQAAKDEAENLIDSSLDIIVSVDRQRRIIAFNRAAERAFGYRKAEVLGRAVDVLYADPAEGLRIHEHSLATGAFAGEITNRRRDGTTFVAYLSASLLRDAQGQVVGVMGVSRDVTEKKQAEAALRAAKEAAETASRTKSQFLANVSHELRTPLNGILGMTELALETALTPEQREYLGMVKSSAEALLGLVNDLLDFSKMEAGKLALEAAPFSLRELLAETLKPLAFQAQRKGLAFVYAVDPEVPDALQGDAGRLRQILVNLVGNAIKFTPRGEIVVRVALQQQTATEACLHVCVQDTGIGIPAAKQRAIFEPFVQGDGSTTRQYGGTGLGLAIVSQLVALMAGRVWVESQEGQGSTFHVTLRLPLQPEAPPLPWSTAALAVRRVLVVEAHAATRQVLCAILRRWGLEPLAVATGASALQALRHAQAAGRPFDLVLLDAQLPDLDGYAVAAQIRAWPPGAKLPLLVLTPPASDHPQRAALRLVSLSKPVGERELWEVLRNLEPAPPAAPAASLPQSIPPGSLRVLLAEDDPVNQRLALRLLEKQGHRVTVVANGAEAVAAVASQPFDLVLMDVQMPCLDGLAATAAIRRQEAGSGRRVPIIAMTAHTTADDRQRCLAAGMDGYVAKPIRAQELLAAIAEVRAAVAEKALCTPSPRREDAVASVLS
ncbi:MAG: hypothetical protein KatS3mg131_3584 [Candidatus Tectimicrobiota bacterium]|nr:MAG: hypothetical protein KatS3mg131_3584 [Candidatus Tectomicrobia bacterium]